MNVVDEKLDVGRRSEDALKQRDRRADRSEHHIRGRVPVVRPERVLHDVQREQIHGTDATAHETDRGRHPDLPGAATPVREPFAAKPLSALRPRPP